MVIYDIYGIQNRFIVVKQELALRPMMVVLNVFFMGGFVLLWLPQLPMHAVL